MAEILPEVKGYDRELNEHHNIIEDKEEAEMRENQAEHPIDQGAEDDRSIECVEHDTGEQGAEDIAVRNEGNE